MVPKASVRSTLLKGLFGRPSRILGGRDFERSRRFLFPCEELFVRFLKTDNSQEMQQLAQRIIGRLCHQHHFLPPTRLITNLLEFEESPANLADEPGYVPQEHFVHQIHLYLLGLYIFSRHNRIHEMCVAELGRLKRAHRQRARLPVASFSTYRFFGVLWAQFVFYHDLGYPLERVEVSRRKEEVDFVKPFVRIRKSCGKDLALKAASRLIVLRHLTKSNMRRALREMYLEWNDELYVEFGDKKWLPFNLEIMGEFVAGFRRSHSVGLGKSRGRDTAEDGKRLGYIERQEVRRKNEKRLLDDLRERWAESKEDDLVEGQFKISAEDWEGAKYLPEIEGAKSLRILLSVVPQDLVCAVLENSVSGQPFALVFGSSGDESPVYLFESYKGLPRSVSRNLKKLPAMAFLDSEAPASHLRWRYFLRSDYGIVEDVIAGLLGDAGGVDVVLEHLQKSEDFVEASVVRSDGADRLAFVVFEHLSKILGYLEEDVPETVMLRSQRIFAIIRRSFHRVAPVLPDLLAAEVRSVMKDDIARDGKGLLESKDRKELARELVRRLISKKVDLESKLAGNLDPEIQKFIDRETEVDRVFRKLRELLPETTTELAIESLLENIEKAGPETVLLGDSTEKAVDKALQEMGLINLKDLVGAYWRDYYEFSEEGNILTFDHGIASSIAAMDCHRVFSDLVSSLGPGETSGLDTFEGRGESGRGKQILRLAFACTSKEEEESLALELSALVREAIPAIVVHNIYPEEIRHDSLSSYTTDLSSRPFAFLALLSDGLQVWDRKRFGDVGQGVPLRVTSGMNFDLEIRDDFIFIRVVYKGKADLKEEEKTLRESLKSYLHGADTFIRLELVERNF